MSNLGKTPVSTLQEHLIGKGIVPIYSLVHNGVGTHNPSFTYRVKVGNQWTEGTARSKQQAKHQAARKMLASLEISDSNTNDNEESDESGSEISENYVGLLKEFCISQHNPDPKYYLEEASGPSHSRIFKMICCVSQLQDFGISTTKKQAKHKAAQKMLQRLKEVSNRNDKEFLLGCGKGSILANNEINDEKIIEKYNYLKQSKTTSTKVIPPKNSNVLYKDHYKAYLDLPETSPTLLKILNEKESPNIDDSMKLIQDIAKELEANIVTTVTNSKEKDETYTVMTMSVFPPIGAVGKNKKTAAFNLLNSLLLLCKESC